MADPTDADLKSFISMNRAMGGPRTKIEKDGVTQELEKPSGKDPNQNAWLTLTLGYSLNFLDSNVRGTAHNGGPIIVQDSEYGWCARDSDDYFFPILPWGYHDIIKFAKHFQQGEQIWNQKFYLVTPENFDRLDYTSPTLPGVVLHPNILCLFQMVAGAKTSQTVDVVKINPAIFEDDKNVVRKYNSKDTRKAKLGFRSHWKLLIDSDVYTKVLGHELGHLLGQEHIKIMEGDAQCVAHKELDRCYGTTQEELRNIMGAGKEIGKINAKPWVDALNSLVGGPPMHCYIFLLTHPGVEPLPPLRMRQKR